MITDILICKGRKKMKNTFSKIIILSVNHDILFYFFKMIKLPFERFKKLREGN